VVAAVADIWVAAAAAAAAVEVVDTEQEGDCKRVAEVEGVGHG